MADTLRKVQLRKRYSLPASMAEAIKARAKARGFDSGSAFLAFVVTRYLAVDEQLDSLSLREAKFDDALALMSSMTENVTAMTRQIRSDLTESVRVQSALSSELRDASNEQSRRLDSLRRSTREHVETASTSDAAILAELASLREILWPIFIATYDQTRLMEPAKKMNADDQFRVLVRDAQTTSDRVSRLLKASISTSLSES